MRDRYPILGSNLMCPNCEKYIPRHQLIGVSHDSLKWGSAPVECRGCYREFHAEDGPLNILSAYPEDNYISFPYAIGATHYLEEVEVTIGRTAVQDVMPAELINRPLFERAVPLHDDDRSLNEVGGEDYRSYRTPCSFDGVGITLGILPAHGTLHVMTSLNENDDDLTVRTGDSFRTGYEIGVQIAEVPNPPWMEYLAEASSSLIRGHRFGAFPLLVSALENHLYRQVAKTLRSQGKGQKEIRGWFNDYRTRLGLDWKSVVRQGLKDLTGTDIGAEGNVHEKTYQRYCSLKDVRDSDVVHVSYLDSTKKLQASDVRKHFDNTVELMVAIYDSCREERDRQGTGS